MSSRDFFNFHLTKGNCLILVVWFRDFQSWQFRRNSEWVWKVKISHTHTTWARLSVKSLTNVKMKRQTHSRRTTSTNKWISDGGLDKREKEGGGGGSSPICSTMSGGKTREAKARRKMSENSLSRPPIPIFSKFQSGLMMDWRDSRVLAFPGGDGGWRRGWD